MLAVVVLAALNAAVTPVGNPVAVRATVPVKPFTPVTLIVLAPLPPLGTVTLAAEAESVKLGTTIVSVTVLVPLKLPEVPVIVSG